MIDKRSQIRRIQSLLVNKSMSNFYGDVVVKFENGNIVYAKVHENIKPMSVTETISLIEQFFVSAEEIDEKFCDKTYMLKKINGKPHLCVIHSGSIENVVSIDDMEEAEKYRYGK